MIQSEFGIVQRVTRPELAIRPNIAQVLAGQHQEKA